MNSEVQNYLDRMVAKTATQGKVDVWPAASDARRVVSNLANLIDPKAEVLTWASNSQHPMADLLAAWLFLGLITETQADATMAAREIRDAAFIAEYREAQDNRTAEEVAADTAEMRAAFGSGETVVNVLTGVKTVL